jgi:hypothetical protein
MKYVRARRHRDTEGLFVRSVRLQPHQSADFFVEAQPLPRGKSQRTRHNAQITNPRARRSLSASRWRVISEIPSTGCRVRLKPDTTYDREAKHYPASRNETSSTHRMNSEVAWLVSRWPVVSPTSSTSSFARQLCARATCSSMF